MSQLEDRGERWHWRRMEQARAEGYRRRQAVEEQERRDAEKAQRQADERALRACDVANETAARLIEQAIGLLTASVICDVAGCEAGLWGSKRVVASGCKSFRELIPAQINEDKEGGVDV